MGIWLDILKLGAAGRNDEARRLLSEELPLSLCSYRAGKYEGPVPRAVARFIFSLPQSDQSMARSYDREFALRIVDDVVDSVRESLDLVQLCVAQPNTSLDELARVLAWKEGKKRSPDQKRDQVAKLVNSMIACDIPLPSQITSNFTKPGEATYPFDEVAYAVTRQRLWKSWEKFKKQQDRDSRFLCITDEAENGVESEGFDYGSISITRIVDRSGLKPEFETTLDLYVIGQAISPELARIMESMHAAEPYDGYHPIAWHNVFWEIGDKYDTLLLILDERTPFCETVQTLADHIASNYREVKATSRPSISRRRTRLFGACETLVQDKVFEYLGMAS